MSVAYNIRNDEPTQELRIVEKTEWIETSEAAEIMGVTVTTVSALCRKGTIECRQHGEGRRSIWEVNKQSALAYQKSVGGRPKKKK